MVDRDDDLLRLVRLRTGTVDRFDELVPSLHGERGNYDSHARQTWLNRHRPPTSGSGLEHVKRGILPGVEEIGLRRTVLPAAGSSEGTSSADAIFMSEDERHYRTSRLSPARTLPTALSGRCATAYSCEARVPMKRHIKPPTAVRGGRSAAPSPRPRVLLSDAVLEEVATW